jgi:ABC-type branched-subunit amino acid transport system substrate-binding protein
MRRIKRSKRSVTAGVALITAALLVASGCTGGSAAKSTQSTNVKGAPIKVMTIGTAGPEEGGSTPAMAQVAIAYGGFINHHGGINGRPLQVTFCDDHDNPSGAEQCARQAVSNRDIAVVGWGSISGGSNILSVLSRANIPWIGDEQFSTAENTSPDSYPIIGSLATQWLGLGQLAGQRGCKKAGVMEWNNPVGIFGLQWFERGFGAVGGKVGPVTLVGTSATDLAPAAAAVSGGGVGCVALLLSPTQGPLAVQALAQAGSKARILFYPDELPQSAITQTGGAHSLAEGALTDTFYLRPSDPRWNQAKQAVKTYAPDPSVVNNFNSFTEIDQLTWEAYLVFTSVIESQHLKTIDGPSLRAALDRANSFNTGGLLPPMNFHTPVVTGPAAPFYNRVFNPYVSLLTIKNGNYTALTPGFVNLRNLM